MSCALELIYGYEQIEGSFRRSYIPMLNDQVEPPDHALYSAELSFCYAEAAANILANSALEPESKIPERKYAGVRNRTRWSRGRIGRVARSYYCL
jgi:hypothetical protein